MSTMLEYVDKHRNQIRAGLENEQAPARIRQVLDDHFVRMLSYYNEACTQDSLREYAASYIMLARSSLSLIDCTGEIRVWEERRDRKSTRLNSSHPTTSRMPSSA